MDRKSYQTIKPLSRQDRRKLDELVGSCNNCTWIDQIAGLDNDLLFGSVQHLLTAEFDHFPESALRAPENAKINESKKKIRVIDVLSSTDSKIIFRFAPSPSGYLHIGHIVPILLNIFFHIIAKKFNKQSNIVLRIDDTNPEEDDFSDQINRTLKNLLGGDMFDSLIKTRSSDMCGHVVDLIDKDFMERRNNFYVDLSDQDTIQKERSERTENKYRMMTADEQIDMWKMMKTYQIKDAVVRAKIDMRSNNGNLRDPVMIRYVAKNGKILMMPTYDLVCPVLDSYDAKDSQNILIALRDANYYDRKEQYYWIQNALMLKPTAMLTFSRVNFADVLLSKRKIKKLITDGEIACWDDPRLMTIDGMFNRGICISGLLNFYWLSGRLSVGNRSTSQDIATLFDHNNKSLSHQKTFIIERMPVDFKPNDPIDPNIWMRIVINHFVTTSDLPYPQIVHKNDIWCKRKRIISHNLKYINDLITGGSTECMLDLGNRLIGDQLAGNWLIGGLDGKSNMYKLCENVMTGDIIKINNFKNNPSDVVFGGYYKVASKEYCSGVLQLTINHIN
jgi:glutamyl/glutaminyl-tRNA synthetase